MKNPKKLVLGGTKAWLVWSLAVLFVVWLFNVQTGYTILNKSIASSLHLTIAKIALSAAVYTWVFAIAQLFSGALLDRAGSRVVLIPAIILVAIGVLILAYAQSFQMVLLAQVVLAIGSSAGFVGAGYVGGMWFGMAKFGIMFGYVQVVVALSSAFGQAGFESALKVTDWRGLLTAFGIFGVGLIALAFIFVRNPQPVERTQNVSLGKFIGGVFLSIGEALKNVQVILSALQGSITFGVMLALGVLWIPKLLVAHGIEQSSAYYASAALWLGLAVGSTFMNHLTDKMKSRKKPLIASTLLQLLCFTALLYVPMTPLIAQILCFIMGIANAGHMLTFTIAGDNVPMRLIGTSASVVNGAMFVVGGILIGVPGRILAKSASDLPAYQHALLIMIVLLVVALLLAFFIKESYPKQEK